MEYEIARKNNQYNKCLKWCLVCKMPTGGQAREWFKTEKEALDRKLWMEEGAINKYRTV